ncbi:MAG: glutamate-1-semialdehyde 2,1-aminomutase [Candidatus Omnitrophica bacterium]|nr:glutamate-1-semialdehyde 2,1-aminomutase [Candidatus Omnitrophota bacterium]
MLGDWEEAKRYIAGGVNSPVRAFKAVGGAPVFISKGKGARIFDSQGTGYIDHVLSWGALILGHAHPHVVSAIRKQASLGTSFGAPTNLETKLARLITGAFPSIERMRFTSSGTEANLSAIRLARGFTKKNKIIKFEGCYHGCVDSLLVKSGSGAATFGVPDSAGISKSTAADTIVVPYNDLGALKRAIARYKGEVACVIVEPICGNMGVVLPEAGFLEGLRKITAAHGILLIFDEVITGFRVAKGGAQGIFGVCPDLTTLGKIIGGGLPVGAFGGRKDIMDNLSPNGCVYQAGTLSGNPLAMSAGIAAISGLNNNAYKTLEAKTRQLVSQIYHYAKAERIDARINYIASMFTIFFTSKLVRDYKDAKCSDTKKYARFFHRLLKGGVYAPPSQFEACFISTAHDDKALSLSSKVLRGALK